MKKLTTEQFIERSKNIHGDTYDYSGIVFNGIKKKVNIVCKKHGEFIQLGQNHLKGSGCPKCNPGRKKLTIEQFIERSNEKHNNKYDYSKTKINGTNKKVVIECYTHGVFKQWPSDHMNGVGCPGCAGNRSLTKESFIQRSNEKHNNKYDYSNVNFKNIRTKINIMCPQHGVFKQTPSDHLQGYGCPACGNVQRVTTERFIERAHKAHNGFYDYSKVKINGMNRNVSITCPIHGDFQQRPADHVNGVGCLECSLGKRGQYSMEYFNNYPKLINLPGILYLVTIHDKWCKIGITKQKTTLKRFSQHKVKVIREQRTTLKQAFDGEQQILEKFKNYRFAATHLRQLGFAGWTECFPISLLPDLIQEFN